MKFAATQHYVYVRPHLDPEKTESGLFIPEKSQNTKDSTKAEIVYAGPGRRVNGVWEEVLYVPGDIVLISKFGQRIVELDGEKLIMVPDSEVIGIWYEEEKA